MNDYCYDVPLLEMLQSLLNCDSVRKQVQRVYLHFVLFFVRSVFFLEVASLLLVISLTCTVHVGFEFSSEG